eukprot:TRINITY_DN42028_c0_g1_i1.p1 TRINITY_DN42028_c0_g1~~TRINITY_DN42028_c0_g1_i1.p1  ORF type:complete len:1228 (-),score=168.92 TRINITY_DN42028_c0_g1_i1:157-3840(-)
MALLIVISLLLCESSLGVDVDMDGEWEFRVDPLDVGEKERWFDKASVPDLGGNLTSPGAWQAQGVGNATVTLNHQYVGVGWYRKILYINRSNLDSKKRVYLWIGGGPGGVMRSAIVYANGVRIGRHIGYWKPLEMELTGVLTNPSDPLTIAVAVDSRWNTSEDAMWGSGSWWNTGWDGYSYGGYGGIVGHSKLIFREAMWIDDSVHVATVPVGHPDGGDWKCQFRVRLQGEPVTAAKISVQIAEWSANGSLAPVARGEPVAVTAVGTEYLLQTTVKNAKLWYPGHESPLYIAIIALKDDAGGLLDEKRSRFGIRSLKIKGNRILWNGERLYLRGYGDDAAYGHSVAPPTTKSIYRKQLEMMRPFGFNYIRLHTHALPTEFFDACDEMGFLVQVELPMEYSYGCAIGSTCPGPQVAAVTDSVKRVYNESFASFVQRYNHHPSIFGYVLSNEITWSHINRDQFAELYRFAKSFDPDRPCWWSDGGWPGWPSNHAPWPADYALYACNGADPSADISNPHCFSDILVDQSAWSHSPSSAEGRSLNSSSEASLRLPADFPIPAILHEASDQRAFPRLQQQLTALSNTAMKPEVFFSQPLQDMARLGLLAENELWALTSEKFYTLTMKTYLEDYLLDAATSGFEWWCGFDWFATANGLIAGDENNPLPKPGIDSSVIAAVQSEVALLIEEPATRQNTGWVSGTFVDIKLLLCNLTLAGIPQWNNHVSEVIWEASTSTSVLANAAVQLSLGLVPQGDTKAVATASFRMPEVVEQDTVYIKARLQISGTVVAQNQWQLGVFPKTPVAKKCKVRVYVSSADLLTSVQTICDEVDMLPSSGVPPGDSAYVVLVDPSHVFSKDLFVAAQKAGAAIILLSPSRDGVFPVCQGTSRAPISTRFRQAWWMSAGSVGTLVYNHSASLTAGLGEFLDFRYQDIIDEALAYNLDTASEAVVHIRSLPAFQIYNGRSMSGIHNLALLWETSLHGGRFIISGFNLTYPSGQLRQTPQAMFMLRRLVQYATEMAGHEQNRAQVGVREKLETRKLEDDGEPLQSFCAVGAEAHCQSLFNKSVLSTCSGDFNVVEHVVYSKPSGVNQYIDAVHIRVATTDVSARLRAVIYSSASDSGGWCEPWPSGKIGKLFAVGQEIGSLPSRLGWVRLPLDGAAVTQPLQAGSYWIGALFSKDMQCTGGQPGREGDLYKSTAYSSGPSDPFGIGVPGSSSLDVFATVSSKPAVELVI